MVKGSTRNSITKIPDGMGPGSYNPDKKFGYSEKKMTLGGPYEFKPDKNPPPGYYDLENAWNNVKPKIKSPHIPKKNGEYKRPKEVTPDAGFYEPNKPFGYSPNKMTLGGKYKWKPNNVPHPCYYDPNDKYTKQRSPTAKMSSKIEKRNKFLDSPSKDNPTAMTYNGITPFGSDNKNKMTLGGKYKWKPNDVPPPGYYDVEGAINRVKPRVQSAVIKEE